MDILEQPKLTAFNGSMSFRQIGPFFPQSVDTAILFSLDIASVGSHVEQYTELYTQHADKLTFPSVFEVNSVRSRLSAFTDFGRREEARNQRSIGSWLAGLFGLYNVYENHHLQGKMTHLSKAVGLTVHEVEAVKIHAQESAKNIRRLAMVVASTTDLLRFIHFAEEMAEEFIRIRGTVDALDALLDAALRHELATGIRSLLDVPTLWTNFLVKLTTASLRPAFDEYQHLFQCHADVAFLEGKLRIAVIVPAIEEGSAAMTLLSWVPKPILLNDSIVEILSDVRDLAVDVGTGATIPLPERSLRECTSLRNVTLCKGGLVRYTDGAGPCISALWANDWSRVATACRLRTRPLLSECWSAGDSGFIASAAEETDVVLRCKGQPRMVMTMGRGLSSLTLPPGCTASTKFWETLPKESKASVIEAYDITTEAMGNLTKTSPDDMPEALKEVTHPKPLVLGSQKALEELRQADAGLSPWTIVAIVLAATALLALAGFILASYLRVKFGPDLLELINSAVRSREESAVLSREEQKEDGDLESQDEPSQSGSQHSGVELRELAAQHQ